MTKFLTVSDPCHRLNRPTSACLQHSSSATHDAARRRRRCCCCWLGPQGDPPGRVPTDLQMSELQPLFPILFFPAVACTFFSILLHSASFNALVSSALSYLATVTATFRTSTRSNLLNSTTLLRSCTHSYDPSKQKKNNLYPRHFHSQRVNRIIAAMVDLPCKSTLLLPLLLPAWSETTSPRRSP